MRSIQIHRHNYISYGCISRILDLHVVKTTISGKWEIGGDPVDMTAVRAARLARFVLAPVNEHESVDTDP